MLRWRAPLPGSPLLGDLVSSVGQRCTDCFARLRWFPVSGLGREAGHFSLTFPGWKVAAKFLDDIARIKFTLGQKTGGVFPELTKALVVMIFGAIHFMPRAFGGVELYSLVASQTTES